ncbi:MAG: hypothetical protein U9Q84_02165, partial [Thermodesulfobacteriota bacterium]|nr:hypothetical protein [Thermodesulfobacteriota bacterium]
FKIVNTSQNAQRVSGHAFVMLKQIEADKKSWLTFPSVPLVSGKPALFKKGQYFSILRFKIMKFKTGNVTDSEQFKTATVFVFSTTGELLLEKSFPVEIKEIVSSQT